MTSQVKGTYGLPGDVHPFTACLTAHCSTAYHVHSACAPTVDSHADFRHLHKHAINSVAMPFAGGLCKGELGSRPFPTTILQQRRKGAQQMMVLLLTRMGMSTWGVARISMPTMPSTA